jgi:hypothetical protein
MGEVLLSNERVPDRFVLSEPFQLKCAEIEIRPAILARPLTPTKIAEFAKLASVPPPIIVTRIDGTWLLLDGYYRLTARMMTGQPYIDARSVEVPDGVELLIAAVVLNRLQKSSIRGSVEKLAAKYPDWSPRQLAEVIGCTPAAAYAHFAKQRNKAAAARQDLVEARAA